MAISINNFGPNTQAKSSEVNQNFSNLKSGVETVSTRSFTWGIQGLLSAGDAQGMQYILPENVTAIKLYAKTSSGTAVIRLKTNAATVTDATNNFSITSTASSTQTFSNAAMTEGQVLQLDIVSTALSATDVFVTLKAQITTII